jgi:hypothetical protein
MTALRDLRANQTLEGMFDLLLERLAERVADKLADRLNDRPTPAAAATEHWLTPQEAARWLQVPVGYTYKHQRELGGVHVSPRVLRFPETALRHRLERRP